MRTHTRDWTVLGVSQFDERVYRAVLQRPGAGTEKWAAAVDTSAAHVHRALGRLAELGLVQLPGSARGDAVAVDPRAAIRGLIRRHEQEFDRLTVAAEELGQDYEQARLRAAPSRLLEVVVGGAAHAVRLRELYERAEREVCLLDTPPYVVDTGLNEDFQAQVLQRGVRFRTVYAVGGLEIPERLVQANRMVSLGEQARVLPAVPLKLVLIDGRTALMPLTTRESGADYSAVVVQSSALTDALQVLFASLWQQAAPLRLPAPDAASAGLKGGPTALERELLTLLAAGLSDQAIIRKLGISERTLRRRIGALQDRLGVSGRFQAGVQATRRGWV